MAASHSSLPVGKRVTRAWGMANAVGRKVLQATTPTTAAEAAEMTLALALLLAAWQRGEGWWSATRAAVAWVVEAVAKTSQRAQTRTTSTLSDRRGWRRCV